ncbi:MAG: DUF4870 domain-containing protein [Planctomycetes bacterium]|jgi:uncharacterized Tic20 family protein|nr:DUF4870 domain-containing protein [Planctomycetota bacterium]MDA8376827.1 DUF4870 domain-containing protein [Planctomycetia bacterium]
MFVARKKWIAALTHLLGPVLTFLPGLALWFWAWDRDPWLKAHGRSAAGFQIGVLLSYVGIAIFFSPQQENLQVHAVPMQFMKDIHQHQLSLLIQLIVAHAGFMVIWAAAIIFSVRSAWLAIRGAPPPHPLWMTRKNGDAA